MHNIFSPFNFLFLTVILADMKVLRIISGVSRRDQWANRISNESVCDGLKVDSVVEIARKSQLKWLRPHLDGNHFLKFFGFSQAGPEWQRLWIETEYFVVVQGSLWISEEFWEKIKDLLIKSHMLKRHYMICKVWWLQFRNWKTTLVYNRLSGTSNATVFNLNVWNLSAMTVIFYPKLICMSNSNFCVCVLHQRVVLVINK